MHAPYRRVAIMHMADATSGAVQLRLLGSSRDVDGGDLSEFYGYPTDHDGVWLRANFIASLDGGATFAGKTGRTGQPRRPRGVRRAAGDGRRDPGRRRHRAHRGLRRRTADRRTAAAPAKARAKRSPSAGDRLQIRSPGPGYAGVHPHRGAAAGLHLHGGGRPDPAHAWPAWPRWSTARPPTRTASTRPRCWPRSPTAGCRGC